LEDNKKEIIILGAGLTGLTIAYLLRKMNISAKILEARDRIGGRIYTLRNADEAAVEMGATWLGKKHTHLVDLLEELGVDIFPQNFGDTAIYEPISTSPPQLVRLPPNDAPSYRIKNGTGSIIETLKSKLDDNQILLEKKVSSLNYDGSKISVNTEEESFECGLVISTLPPALFFKHISTSPALPDTLKAVAEGTHTWMGDSIKVAICFENAFWESKNLSGTIFSGVGPIPEMYDHSNIENDRHALMGFLNGSYFKLTREERLEMILKQLKKYYGDVVMDYKSYHEVVWTHEEHTSTPYTRHVMPHENNGHPFYNQGYFDGRLFFGGAETSSVYGGYMEGAVASARGLFKILDVNKSVLS